MSSATVTLDIQVVDRATRQGIAGLRVEAWAAPGATVLDAANTDAGGKCRLALDVPDATPAPHPLPAMLPLIFKIYQNDKLLATNQNRVRVNPDGGATPVVLEVDRPGAPAPGPAWVIAGQVLDQTTHTGIAGLRVEAWDKDATAARATGPTDTGGRFRIPLTAAAFGGQLPDPATSFTLKVFQPDGTTPLPTPAGPAQWVPATSSQPLTVVVNLPTPAPASLEVGLHELGDNVAATLAALQQELARYPNALGAFVVDELALDIPVRLRVDSLGQIMATVAGEIPAGTDLGKLHLSLRPVLGATPAPPAAASQPLLALGVLSPTALAYLAAQRVFSVDDLLRVAAKPAGYAALDQLDLGAPLDQVLSRATLLTHPALPAAVAESLLQLGVTSAPGFVSADPAQIAKTLAPLLNQPITAEDVKAWQGGVAATLDLPLPSRRPNLPDSQNAK